MKWIVEFHDKFEEEFDNFPHQVQDKLYALSEVLEQFGPTLGRPKVDTLYDSKHNNMKELRFDADNGVWRTAFAFDSNRKAILLVAGNKTGVNVKRFYKELIKKADKRFDDYLKSSEI